MTENPSQYSHTEQSQFESEAWMYDANKSSSPKQKFDLAAFLQSKTGRFTLIGVTVLVGILLLVSLAAMMGGGKKQVVDSEDETEVTAAIDLGPLGERARKLKAELKLADPNKEQDPFPGVNLKLRLDEAKTF